MNDLMHQPVRVAVQDKTRVQSQTWRLESTASEQYLVIRRIHVSMRLVAPEDTREKAQRAHTLYPMNYRTLHNAIQLTSSLHLVAS